MKQRFKNAFHTNEPQANAVFAFSFINVAAAIQGNAPWWGYVLSALIWPMIAFIINFIDPIPK